MRKFLLILSLLACVALSGCGSGDSNKSSSADDSIKGNVEIRDEKGSVLITMLVRQTLYFQFCNNKKDLPTMIA